MGEHSHRPAASNGAAAEAGTYETVTLHVAGEAPCRRDQQVLWPATPNAGQPS